MKIMKSLFFILLFALPLFAQYSEPPHNEVRANNEALASVIDSLFAGTTANETPTIYSPFYFANARIFAAYPSVDNRLSDNKTATIMFSYAERHLEGASLPFTQNNGLSDQDCADYSPTTLISLISSSKTAEILFTYKNFTRKVIPNSSFAIMPFSEEELKSEKPETLKVAINATFSLVYQRYIIYYKGSKCDSLPLFGGETANVTFTRNAYNEENYTMENGQLLYFLSAPVLGEQWYRDNVFNSLILSKRRFHSANFSIDGNTTASVAMRVFNITTDAYGVEKIISVDAGDYNFPPLVPATGGYEHITNSTPIQLEKTNESFSYGYEFNTSYAGIGRHELSLRVVDDFGNGYDFTENLLSRKLSSNGIVEGGSELNGENVRKSATIPYYGLDFKLISVTSAIVLLSLVLSFGMHR